MASFSRKREVKESTKGLHPQPSLQDNMLAVNALCKTQIRPSLFTLHVYELTFISGGGRDDAGDKVAQPVTIVRVCVSVFDAVIVAPKLAF